MAFLEGDEVELVPLDPAVNAHVEAYRRSRDAPAMRATGYYGQCLTEAAACERLEARRGPTPRTPTARFAPRARWSTGPPSA
jgi:hypothetical protein